MSIAQIYAIIALLVAFNVPQATVTQVQGILQQGQATTSQAATTPISVPQTVNSGNTEQVADAPEVPVPTSMVITSPPGYTTDANGPLLVYGGSCSITAISVKVLDQDGNEIVSAPVYVGSINIRNPYTYKSPNFNTTDTLTFNSNGLATTSVNVDVGGALADNGDPGTFFKDSPTIWRVKQSGANYNPITNTC